MTVRRYDTDPSTPGGLVLPRSIFDPSPHRNRGQERQRQPFKHLPDERLIATLVAHGQPRWAAEEVKHHPGVRFAAFRFWCDVQDAAEGNKAAQERVDRCRGMWDELRKSQQMSDQPSHVEDFG